jgi:hypothetical protein
MHWNDYLIRYDHNKAKREKTKSHLVRYLGQADTRRVA